MTFQDFGMVVELVFLILIWLDGRTVLNHTKQQTDIHRESLEAQKEYLNLRRRWYEQRSKKKEEKLTVVVGSPSNDNITN